MQSNALKVNNYASLQNIGVITYAIEKVMNRPDYLPGLIVVRGPSGYGKTFAASYAAIESGAYYVSAKSTWTKKTFLQAILNEMSVPAEKTVGAMMDQVCSQLSISNRPLIIDEFDYCVESKALTDMTRDIYDGSQAAIILIGEERLPDKLEKIERFHNRILDWINAVPANFDDAVKLRAMYCKKVEIADDLLKKVWEKSEGRVRRIVVNLAKIEDDMLAEGKSRVDLAGWGKRELITGNAPLIRSI